ncbi:MAG: molybdopterin oxidoreductase iron-sulfur binding subunit [Symbiobacteriaceae bacterium]|jgi:Fe-S-cluster-containing dehydrogenase component|nr:molybdopterin oxidoreductase iron-sulfur binding subunit [Symbiobacteriaceae bacterium]
MTRYAYYIDLSICAGCESCTVACQNKNGLAPELAYTKVHRFETGTFPNLKSSFVAGQCFHCDEPACAAACPTGATYKTDEGPVLVNEAQCIGCKYCMVACPYDARVFDEEMGAARKCTECADRLASGRKPACVETCLTGARVIGDLDDPKSPIHALITQPDTVQMAGAGFYFRLPEGIAKEALPEARGTGVVYAWQSILQPLGQLLMGGAAAALLASAAAFAVKSVRGGGTEHGHD